MTIRPARPADLPAALALLAENRLPLAGVADHFDSFLVAEDGGRLIGLIGVERYPPHGLLRSAAVAADRRGEGVGEALVTSLADQCSAQGFAELWLLTETAQRWFERRGFVQVPRGTAPAGLGASAELTGACPATAVLMTRTVARLTAP